MCVRPSVWRSLAATPLRGGDRASNINWKETGGLFAICFFVGFDLFVCSGNSFFSSDLDLCFRLCECVSAGRDGIGLKGLERH